MSEDQQRKRWQGITDVVDELKQKRFELAEREFHSMDEAEIIDLLLMYVYEKMDDEAVELLHNDIFAER